MSRRLKNVRVKRRRTPWSSKPLRKSRLLSVSFLKISHHRDHIDIHSSVLQDVKRPIFHDLKSSSNALL